MHDFIKSRDRTAQTTVPDCLQKVQGLPLPMLLFSRVAPVSGSPIEVQNATKLGPGQSREPFQCPSEGVTRSCHS